MTNLINISPTTWNIFINITDESSDLSQKLLLNRLSFLDPKANFFQQRTILLTLRVIDKQTKSKIIGVLITGASTLDNIIF